MKIRTPQCGVCGETSMMDVDENNYRAWKFGSTLLQDAFPQMPKEEREVLKTGIHPACWLKLFPPQPEVGE